MSKSIQKNQPAKDVAKTKAVERIAQKYNRSIDWGYKIAADHKTVQGGEYYEAARKDYKTIYQEIKQFLG